LQESRSAAAQFRQKPLLGKAQSPFSFNALEILHGRLFGFSVERRASGRRVNQHNFTVNHGSDGNLTKALDSGTVARVDYDPVHAH
jgi:hypothetical protein